METVRVNKVKLLETLRENAVEHGEEVAEAQAKYRDRAIAAMQKKIEAMKSSAEPVELDFDLPVPRSFRKEYARAIEMLEWTVGDELEISEMDFRNWILNEWGWRSTYASTTGSYLVHPS